MRRSALTLLPLLFVAAGLSSCGGGGGDPDPGDGGNGGNPVSELASVRTDAILSPSNAEVDATNLFVGERAQFRLTGIPTSGVRQFVSVRGWTTTVPANVGTITTDGLFTAGPATGTGTVRVTVDGTTYTGTVTVKGGSAIGVLTGRIRLVNGAATSGIGLRALDASGAVVATGFSATDGTIRIGVPSSARRLNLNFDAIDPNANFYVRQFAYAGTDYSSEIAGCTAPLPTITNGATTPLTGDLVVYLLSASAPPPPPDGCGAAL